MGGSAVWLRFVAELRARWRGTLALVVLLGLVGSVVLAAMAGARRTSTAPDRLVSAVGGEGDAHIFDVGGADPDRIRALPQVEHSVAITFFLADSVPLSGLEIVTTDDPLFHGLVAEGRLPDPADPLGAVIDQKVARKLGLDVGDQLDVILVTSEQLAAIEPGTELAPSATLRVAAVVREPDDIVGGDPAGDEAAGSDATVYAPESFLERFGDQTEVINTVYYFDLVGGGAAVDEFVAAVRDLPDGDTVQFFDAPGVGRATQRSVDAQALGLGLFAAALAMVGFLTAGQSLSRQVHVDASDGEALRALGMTDGQRIAVASLRGALVGISAAVLAVGGAVALSPLTPVGLARQAEPDPGVEVNVAVLAVGAAAIAAIVTARAVLTGWQIVGRWHQSRVAVGSALAERAARAGAAPSLVTGLSLARGWRGSGVSTRSTLAGVTAGVVAVVASVTFLASLDRLVAEPERYGWTFDAVAGGIYEDDPGDLFETLADEPGIESFAKAGGLPVGAEGRRIGVLGVEAGQGITLPVLEGRAPVGSHEVALGRSTLDELGKEVGDPVTLDGGGDPLEFTVTGTAVVPEINQGGPGLGEGGVMPLESLVELVPDEQPNVALVRFAPGGEDSAAMAQLRSAGELLPPVLPDALYDVERVRTLPKMLAGLLGLLGLATLVHSLVSLVRTHRRDLAMLKTLGFTRSQVAATTAWQGTAFVAVALVVGVPLGIGGGRWVWQLVADQLGVVSAARVPLPGMLVVVPAALLVANLAAAIPGWLAARIRPAEALRTE
ncbi:MAG TPA: FtsX-like permease family protein [Acidimicrobiales bacterium]|nr:FtsX-like permease family protein [Acidimicrobiales bacterium]